MRLCTFGGSFDPVHKGHMVLAECCLEQAHLDELWLVPARRQPHKPWGAVASEADRVAMLEAAVRGRERLRVSTIEIDRGGVSFTVDTLRQMAAENPGAELFLALGADALPDVPKWKEPGAIFELATPLFVDRAGFGEADFDHLRGVVPPKRLAEIEAAKVVMPPTDVSSSRVRELVASNGPWRELVPEAVAEVIQRRKLYGCR